MADIVIFGTGDIARLAHYYFTRDSGHTVRAFTVDLEFMPGDTFLGLPVVPFDVVRERFPPASHRMFVALSYAKMNHLRAEKYLEAKQLGYELVSYVSTRCSFLADAPVGDNCFILEDNSIQPFVTIGNDVTLWSGNHIGHDSVIGDHCFLASHIVVSGHVTIGPFCFIGVNATLRNSITIAAESLIGAGAIIMGDTVERGVYVPERTVVHHSRTSDQIKL